MENKKFYLITWLKKSMVVSAESDWEAAIAWMDHEEAKRSKRKLKTPFNPGDYEVQEIEGLNIEHAEK